MDSSANSQNRLLNALAIKRSLVKKSPSMLPSYQTTSISKHYEVNKQILHAFESNYENKLFKVAYAFGIQFVETALLEIPKHGYFYSSRHAEERVTNSLDAIRVTNMLQEIQNAENAGPDEKERVRKLADLALEQAESASLDTAATYEGVRANVEKDLRSSEMPYAGLCGELLAYGDSLCPPRFSPTNTDSILDNNLTVAASTSSGILDTARTLPPRSTTRGPSGGLPPLANNLMKEDVNAVKSYLPPQIEATSVQVVGDGAENGLDHRQDHAAAQRNLVSDMVPQTELVSGVSTGYYDQLALERALYLSGLEVKHSDDDAEMAWALEESRKHEEQQFRERLEEQVLYERSMEALVKGDQDSQLPRSKLEIEIVRAQYHEEFDSLWDCGQIRVTQVDTYQGKVQGSTNGCTIIAPLVCIHHFINKYDDSSDPGLPDSTMKNIIDEETPAILPKVREELGLTKDAFLIPSDAHDYLIQSELLSQDQFVDVCGGNIMDEKHLSALVDHLARRKQDSDSKLAVTLFFHQHVIAILKLRRGDGAWYDLIDSLPSKETLTRHGAKTPPVATDEFGFPQEAHTNTCRIRCIDEKSLMIALRWYACSRFSLENLYYIDAYEWDDANSDFDPRVFQAFLWTEM